MAVSAPPQPLVERLKDYGQEDVFALWDDLSPEERDLLVGDIENLDLPRLDRIIRCSLRSQGNPSPTYEPVPESKVSTVEERTTEERERWWKMGLKAISESKLGVLLLAGGQHVFRERLLLRSIAREQDAITTYGDKAWKFRSQRVLQYWTSFREATLSTSGGVNIMCAETCSSVCSASTVRIHWYIMTSPFMDEATRRFFEIHKYFGLEADQITFFQQGTIPCITNDGKFIMETPYKVAKAPDGNGGVYSALKASRLLEDMAMHGIRYIDCYGVDNALVRVADPMLLGYFIEKGVSAAAKVVRKAYPQEKVGVFVQRGKGGPVCVLEYSEMDASMACDINQSTGRLRFCWSNVCLHMFTLDFLNQVANCLENDATYHLVEKRIPSIHGHTTGLKLEQFIFDAFIYSPSTALYEALREEEFAPVKNVSGSDTPDSARLLVLRLHTRWVIAAGGFLTHSVPLYATGVEVSPLLSYVGENLEHECRARTFHAPSEISI